MVLLVHIVLLVMLLLRLLLFAVDSSDPGDTHHKNNFELIHGHVELCWLFVHRTHRHDFEEFEWQKQILAIIIITLINLTT